MTVMTPTPEQAAIIEAAQRPQSLLINALAGTGKTTTLTMLAKALPRKPSLALAFNKKIKEDLAQRFPPHFDVMTLNGLGHRAWSFKINSRNMVIDANKLGRLVKEALKPFPESKGQWANMRALLLLAMQRGLVPAELGAGLVPDTPDTWEALDGEIEAGLTTEERKLARRVLISSIEEGHQGVISFDDQIYLPVVFNGAFPKFDTVLVDEAQDLSPLNHQMLARVARDKLIVVGDPRQAIYAFRGADHNSMTSLKALRSEWIELPLNTTFRCPRAVVARQQDHAPAYRAAPTNPQGAVHDFRKEPWDWRKIQTLAPSGDIAILCRNNAPLVSMAFKLLRHNVGVNMLGRDIGRGLSNLVRRLAPESALPIESFKARLGDWFLMESSKAEIAEDGSKLDSITDRHECILAVIDHRAPRTTKALISELDNLFSNDRGLVTLATGHKAKGLEWSTVIHLDPWRIPSRFAKKESEAQQEANLRYVIETRTKRTLVLADLKGFES